MLVGLSLLGLGNEENQMIVWKMKMYQMLLKLLLKCLLRPFQCSCREEAHDTGEIKHDTTSAENFDSP